MKKTLFAVLAIFIFCSTGSAAIKDSPDGFRGIKWGQSPSALGKYTLLAHTGGLGYYLKNDDKLKIGDADLTSIMYIFWENKFVMAVIQTEGSGNSNALRTAMIARYGEPEHGQNNANESSVWHDDNIVITYNYNMNALETSAAIANKPLLQKMLGQGEAAAQKGVNDF